MQNDKLLPCPFCGGEARISCDTEAKKDSQGRLWAFTAVCDSCCATSGLCYSVDMATKSWNTRKPMERIIDRLEEIFKHHSATKTVQRLVLETVKDWWCR